MSRALLHPPASVSPDADRGGVGHGADAVIRS